MNIFQSLQHKEERLVIGILSGTSVDGVDTVLVKIKGKGKSMKIKIIDFDTFPIRKDLKEKIIESTSSGIMSSETVCRLNFVIGHLFSECIMKLIKRNNYSPNEVDLIGSHGLTLFHYPFDKKYFGKKSKSTFQIGDLSVIAVNTGITTVGDFRTADVASGGDGAPLVPYLDYILFGSKFKNLILLNIGGISNCTYLKKSCSKDEVIAFDTGPGNMLIDEAVKKLFNMDYDKDGEIALMGKSNPKLFSFLKSSDNFYRKKYPKSTGREYYGRSFLEKVLKNSRRIPPEDIIATLTDFTAYTIYFNVRNLKTDEIFVSGGGAKNKALMTFFKNYLKGIPVSDIQYSGINTDNKEAVLFAVLANELVNGIKTNMRSVTGSSKDVFLGKICLA